MYLVIFKKNSYKTYWLPCLKPLLDPILTGSNLHSFAWLVLVWWTSTSSPTFCAGTMLCPLSPRICSVSHNILLFVPEGNQACFHLKTFTLPVLSAWNSPYLASFFHLEGQVRIFTSLTKCHMPQGLNLPLASNLPTKVLPHSILVFPFVPTLPCAHLNLSCIYLSTANLLYTFQIIHS